MPALVARTHVFLAGAQPEKDVDGRDKPGHDSADVVQYGRNAA